MTTEIIYHESYHFSTLPSILAGSQARQAARKIEAIPSTNEWIKNPSNRTSTAIAFGHLSLVSTSSFIASRRPRDEWDTWEPVASSAFDFKKESLSLQVTTHSLTSFYGLIGLHVCLRYMWDLPRFLLFPANAAIASGVILSKTAFKAVHPIDVFSCCTIPTAIDLKTSHEFIVSCFEWLYQVTFFANVRDCQAILR